MIVSSKNHYFYNLENIANSDVNLLPIELWKQSLNLKDTKGISLLTNLLSYCININNISIDTKLRT